tara:strand:- start:487 stop:780 length:294 start_codon:yes stop_codon:yes gene_type:complete
MISILFLFIGSVAIWTGIVLFKKGPKDEEIKMVLTDLGNASVKLANSFFSLAGSLKNLITLLKESTPQLQDSESKVTNGGKTPNLVSLENKNNKKAA